MSIKEKEIMKRITLGFTLTLLAFNFCYGQNSNSQDFFELGFRYSKFIESSFLENSKYKDELSDPNTEIEGIIASPTGNNLSIKFRYGKKIFNKVHLISEFGYSHLNEQVICFCHACDKVSNPSTLVSLNAINIGLGTRYSFLNINNFHLAFDLIGNYSSIINESGISYIGVSVQPLIEYEINKKININLKLGFEESFKDYQKKEKYIEFAVKYKISKKAS